MSDRSRLLKAAVPAPGIVHGEYPERQAPEAGWLEQAAARGADWLLRRRRRGPEAYRRFLAEIERHGAELSGAADAVLATRILELRRLLARHGFRDDLVILAFALIREMAHRTLGLRHYEMQLIGGWLMLQGAVAEMETGAGKTLTATLPAATAALAGVPVHVITVNDYLVTRDAAALGPLYRALGLSVGTVTENMDAESRRQAYRCNIAYCSNKQVVFDYLRDRLALGQRSGTLRLQLRKLSGGTSAADSLLLRGLCYAIVDEADSILVDEARTPLIISRGSGGVDNDQVFRQAMALAGRLAEGIHFRIENSTRTIELTEAGKSRLAEEAAELGGVWRGRRRARGLVIQALNACHLFLRDKHYLVRNGKVEIIDEFTGRTMADRSWEQGLHQMIEVKEGCAITGLRETLARISYQQFFRRYLRLAGMTGTAREVAGELWSVYRLRVMPVPSQWPIRRRRHPTRVYRTQGEKWAAVEARIAELHAQGRPVLVGTRSVAASEHLGRRLEARGLRHDVLNAKQDEREAEIIQTAGGLHRIVVATNMAGRGADIKLGTGVLELGGLHVIATEAHEAGRIDRQLFGRCGRQGDPGSFEMMLSLEDDLLAQHFPGLLRPLLGLVRHGIGPRLGWIAVRLAQKTAEHTHSRIRRELLRSDEQLRNLLAFSGVSE